MSFERDEATIDEVAFPRLSDRMSRAFAAMKADLRLVDSGSLDVLLYCTDDVAVGAPADWKLTGSTRLT